MSDEHTFPPEPVPRRRAPAGQALAVVLIALLVGAVLNAERLDYTARTQPYGWQRRVAMGITGPLASFSRATHLNAPRKAIADAVDNQDPPPPKDTRDVVIAGEAGVATSSTTTTTSPPRVPTAADPVRILVAGDSLMGWIGPGISSELDGKPIDVIEDWKVGTGLARPDVRNWPAALADDMTSSDPEVVVVGFGGNDAQDMTTDQGRVTVGTRAWEDEYERRVVQVLDAIEKPGRTVYWVGVPITTRANIERAAPSMARAVQREVDIRPWAHYVDSASVLSPDGTYTAYLPDGSGGEVKVREDDGVHPNPAGGRRIVASFAPDLAEERNLTP